MSILQCLEGYFRTPLRTDSEKLPYIQRMREIFGNFHHRLGFGFIPDFRNPHSSLQLQSLATLWTVDWETLSQYDDNDAELDMIVGLIKENDSLDVLNDFYLSLKVCNPNSYLLVRQNEIICIILAANDCPQGVHHPGWSCV